MSVENRPNLNASGLTCDIMIALREHVRASIPDQASFIKDEILGRCRVKLIDFVESMNDMAEDIAGEYIP